MMPSRNFGCLISMITLAMFASAAIAVGAQEPRGRGEDGFTPPTKTKNVLPVYPAEAKAAGIQGVVFLEFILSKEGFVGSPPEVKRSVEPTLDAAAVEAVRQWEYKPALRNGEPVEVVMTVTVNFSLQN